MRKGERMIGGAPKKKRKEATTDYRPFTDEEALNELTAGADIWVAENARRFRDLRNNTSVFSDWFNFVRGYANALGIDNEILSRWDDGMFKEDGLPTEDAIRRIDNILSPPLDIENIDYSGADLSFPANAFASDDTAPPPPPSPLFSDDGQMYDVLRAVGVSPPPSPGYDFDSFDFDDMEGKGYGGATNAQIGQAARYRTRVREALDPPKYECLYRNLSYIVHSSDDGVIGNPFSPSDKYDADVQKILDKAEMNLKRVKELRDAGIEPRRVPKCSGKVFKPETTPSVQPSLFKASTRKRAPATAVDFFTAPAPAPAPAQFDFAAIDKLRKTKGSDAPAPSSKKKEKFPLWKPTPALIEATRLKQLEGRGRVGGNLWDDIVDGVSMVFGSGRRPAQYPYLL